MKTKNIIAVLGAALLMAGCSDFLDQQPTSEIPAGEMWENARDAKAGVNEIYGLLRTTLRENYWYWGEFRSDNYSTGASTAVEQERVIRNLMTTELACTRWTNLYKVINQANMAIKYLPGINMPSVSEKNDLLGQAYAMRALAYLYAIRVWGDVPLFTQPTETYNPEEIYKERTAESEILQLMLTDLRTAETLIDRNSNKERKRISIFGVWAIMADTYMWMHEYNLADQTIDKIRTTNTSFMDFESSIDTWQKMFQEELNYKAPDDTPSIDDYSTKEFILTIHYSMSEVGTNGYSLMYQWFSTSGNRAAVVSDKVLAMIDGADKRKEIITQNYQGGWELRKFVGETKSSTLFKTCEVAYPIYRYTDMLLLQAECKVHLGRWAEALELVKRVRDRAGLSTPVEGDFHTPEELLDFILDERQVELIGEGRRWFDLRRTGKWKEVMEPLSGLVNDGNELFPIHYSHIRENTKLRQNSYYGTSSEQ